MADILLGVFLVIAILTGKILSKSPNEVVIDCSGVGYHVHTTLTTFEKLPPMGEMVTLYILTYVREDALSLYGFSTGAEKKLFTKLLKVNGIGPKLATSILSGVPPYDFIKAVINEDLARLNAIPGVGKKTAERIIIDLKDKIADETILEFDGETKPKGSIFEDALSALTNLGYTKNHVEKVLSRMGMGKESDLTLVIKTALKDLASL